VGPLSWHAEHESPLNPGQAAASVEIVEVLEDDRLDPLAVPGDGLGPGEHDQAIATLLAHAFRSRSPRSYTIMFQLGGTVGRVADDAAAISGRSAGFAVNVNGVALPEEYAEQAAWVRDFGQALRPLSARVYMNFLDDEGQDRVRAAYGPAKHARLVALKDAWDAENFFRCNQNIQPSA